MTVGTKNLDLMLWAKTTLVLCKFADSKKSPSCKLTLSTQLSED